MRRILSPRHMAAVLLALLGLLAAGSGPGLAQKPVPLENGSYIINIPSGFSQLDPAVVAEHHKMMQDRIRSSMPDWSPLFEDAPPPEHGFSPVQVKRAPLASPHLLVDEHVGQMNTETDATVLAATIRAKLVQNLRALSASEPVPLFHHTAPDTRAFYVEYMVNDPEEFAPEYHAFRVVLCDQGLVVAYWYAFGDDYARYVRDLRPAAMSLKFLPR